MSAPDLPQPPAPTDADTNAAHTNAHQREYDQSGFYPSEGKKFRVWALLGWNIGIIVAFALIAAAINYFALGE